MQLKSLFIKFRNWEYWPYQVVYAPILPYWFWLSLKARSLFFFSTSNPLIENGGFALERKDLIYDMIPDDYKPFTVLCNPRVSFFLLKQLMDSRGLHYPVIAKPNIGQRGIQVKLIRDDDELFEYTKQIRVDFLLQEYIAYEHEVGVFYYRIPGTDHGQISGIVGKVFLTVTGDGSSTIREILVQNPRHLLQLQSLEHDHPEELDVILEQGTSKVLVPYGNHSRGAMFLDLSNRISPELTRTIDNLCKQIPQFYFGRLDIKYKDWEGFCRGENFSIIELNGAGSEPTHIYDPKHSIFFAWKEILRHWKLLYEISIRNRASKKLDFMSYKAGMDMIRYNKEYIRSISS